MCTKRVMICYEFRKNKTGCEIAWSLWLFTIYAVNLFSTAIDSTSVVLCDKIKIKSSEFHISSSFFSLAAYHRPKSFITTWNGNFMEARKNRFTKIENWIISTVVWISYRYTTATSHLKSAIAIHAIEFSCCDLMLTCIFVIIFSIVIIERVRIISQFIFPLQRLNLYIAHCRLI